jgi:DNA-binding transcriptional ArsR family regulator
MLGAVSIRLGQEKVRDQFGPSADVVEDDPRSFSARLAAVASERRLTLLLCLSKRARSVTELSGLCGFDGAIASEDLELLSRHGLVERDRDGVWSVCCPVLAPSVERLVNLVLTTPPVTEAT